MIRLGRALVIFIVTLAVAAASGAIVMGRIGRTVRVATVKQYVSQCGNEPDRKLKHIHYFGIIADRKPGTKAYTRFVKSTGVTPSIVDYFVSWGAPWDPVPACYAVSQGALPLIQINLYKQHLSNIARGSMNNYIVRFADQVKNFGLPVVLSLGHEMNGNWYPWGWKGRKGEWNTYHKGAGVGPKVFVAFWHKVHQLFARQKVYNVIWLWTVNRFVRPATDPNPWWPGKQYVNWVGIDGHYTVPYDRFSNVFGKTIRDIRQVTTDPILIAESAIRPGPARPAQITNLFNSVYREPGMLGVIYFDMPARYDWRLHDQASIHAFRKAVAQYEDSAEQPEKKARAA
jgi:mannan endo-1,4-beta-mannosidase